MYLTINRRMISALFILLSSGCNFAFTQQFHPQSQQQSSEVTPVNGAPASQLPAESRSLSESNKSSLISQFNPTALMSERANIFQKLNIFSSKKRKNKEQDPMMASDSIPMTRFTPFAYPSATGASSLLAGQRPPSPFASFMTAAPSNRAINYFNPFLYGSNPFDPYASIARRMAVASHPARPPFMPMSTGQIPTYFPLGSMMGTPIMDPNIGAALASTLTNRYSQNPLGSMVGSSIYGTSLYEDPYDSGLLASALKRYFKSGGRGRAKPRDEVRMPSDYSYDKFEYGYSTPRYEGYSRENRRPAASSNNRYREPEPYPRYQSNSYDYSGHNKVHPDDVAPGSRDNHQQSESNPDDYRNYDGRTGSGSDSVAAPPPPPPPSPPAPAQASSTVGRFRERAKDTNEGPYVDMYGWRGPAKSFAAEGNQRNQQADVDDGRRVGEESSSRQPIDRYGHDAPAYGSRSNIIPSPPSSTYKDSVNRNDLDAVSSDAHEKGRSIY